MLRYFVLKIKDAHYSGDFKREFMIFYEELKEFFNAQGLEGLLEKTKHYVSSNNLKHLIDEFLSLKRKGELKHRLKIFAELRQALLTVRDEPSTMDNKNLYHYVS